MSNDNHIHKNHSHHLHTHGVVKNMYWAFGLNAFFTIIEFIGGVIFNSTAILSDAVHDLGDTLAIGSNIYLEKKSLKKVNSTFTYGFRRLSVLAGLANAIILISGSAIMAFKAIERIIDPEPVNSLGMFWMAVLGVLFNSAAVWSMKKSKQGINAKTMYLHLLEDALGWVVILIGSLLIGYYNIPVLDPILSLCLSLFIAYNGIKLLKPVYLILMATVPKSLDMKKLNSKINDVVGLIELHDTHVWSLDGEYHILSAHALIRADATAKEENEIKTKIIEICRNLNIFHTTLEIERDGDECRED